MSVPPTGRFYELLRELAWVHEMETSNLKALPMSDMEAFQTAPMGSYPENLHATKQQRLATPPPSEQRLQVSGLVPSSVGDCGGESKIESGEPLGLAQLTVNLSSQDAADVTKPDSSNIASRRSNRSIRQSGSALTCRSNMEDPNEGTSKLVASLIEKCTYMSDWLSTMEEPSTYNGRLAALVFNERFSAFCIIVIISHACYMTYSSNVAIASYLDRQPRGLANTIIELGFLSFYTLEVGLKLYVRRMFFFTLRDKAWNVFDFALVIQGIIDEIVAWAIEDAETSTITFLRLARALKLGKVLRTLRAVMFFDELRLMIHSIAGSISALFWSFVTLGILLFIFSLVFVQLVSAHLAAHHQTMGDEKVRSAVRFFGSVQLTSLTLYKCTSGGVDWQYPYNVLEDVGFLSAFLFILFLVFFHFSVMNIVMGVVLENVTKYNAPSREARMVDKAKEHEELCAELEAVLHELDVDSSGTLSWEEFQEAAGERDVSIYLELLGINLKDAELFFNVLVEAQGSSDLAIGDIVRHCTRMKGVATGIDMQCLSFQLGMVQRSLDIVVHSLDGSSEDKPRPRPKPKHGFQSKSHSKLPKSRSYIG